jgi:hypothetical protein
VSAESDENDSIVNFGTGLHIMIITYDEDSGIPEVDLGDMSPYLAITMLQSVIESLEYLVPSPRVVFKGQVIFDPNFGGMETEETVEGEED